MMVVMMMIITLIFIVVIMVVGKSVLSSCTGASHNHSFHSRRYCNRHDDSDCDIKVIRIMILLVGMMARRL